MLRPLRWFTRHRKSESVHDTIAAELFELYVEKQAQGTDPKTYGIPRTIRPDFRAKLQLYREALVLLALSLEAQDDPRFEDALKSYEKFILPGTPTPEGLEKLERLKAAMRDLGSLISGGDKKRQLSWAKDWLNSIGHEEWNPVTLILFASNWMLDYTGIAGTLKDIARTVFVERRR